MKDICTAIVRVLMKRYIKFPVGEGLHDLIASFEDKWGFLNCGSAINDSHIPIAAPVDYHTDYYNRKVYYSMSIQGVVDHKYCSTGQAVSMRHVCLLIHLFMKRECQERCFKVSLSEFVMKTFKLQL